MAFGAATVDRSAETGAAGESAGVMGRSAGEMMTGVVRGRFGDGLLCASPSLARLWPIAKTHRDHAMNDCLLRSSSRWLSRTVLQITNNRCTGSRTKSLAKGSDEMVRGDSAHRAAVSPHRGCYMLDLLLPRVGRDRNLSLPAEHGTTKSRHWTGRHGNNPYRLSNEPQLVRRHRYYVQSQPRSSVPRRNLFVPNGAVHVYRNRVR